MIHTDQIRPTPLKPNQFGLYLLCGSQPGSVHWETAPLENKTRARFELVLFDK